MTKMDKKRWFLLIVTAILCVGMQNRLQAQISDGTNTYTDLATAINACNTTGTTGSPYTLTVSGNATIGTGGVAATIDKNIVVNVVSNNSTKRTITRASTSGNMKFHPTTPKMR